MKLKRWKNNPILEPKGGGWESKAVFNPAVLFYKNRIHIFYRAIGEYENYISRIGHAIFSKNLSLIRRKENPVLKPKKGRCYEDPRITKIENKIYMTYVDVKSFQLFKIFEKKFHIARKFSSPHISTNLISLEIRRENVFFRKGKRIIKNEKDVVLFPERINGKMWVLHRPYFIKSKNYKIDKPSIWIGNLENGKIKNSKLIIYPTFSWEKKIVGAGVPPIKTKEGWLLIYHGADEDHVYRAGAALLDLEDPTKVIARTKKPILQPEKDYELYGDVNNVVFPTGSVIIKNTLYIFYGAADKRCCVAYINLDNFIDYVKKQKL